MLVKPIFRAVLYLAVTASLLGGFSAAEAATASYTVTASDGVKLAVQESGAATGPTVILIHGLLGSHLTWGRQVSDPRLQEFRLITYDLRGHGLSGKPLEREAYTDGRRWADDLEAVIESSHARDAVLVGWSLGGAVMTNYLAAYGDSRIAGAVYVDGVIELKPDQITAHPEVYRDLASEDLGTHLDAERVFLGLCFNKRPEVGTFERLLSNAAMASWVMEGAISSMTIQTDGLSAMHKPVLLLYGARDALVQTKPALARASALNPRARTLVYADSGHAPFLEESARFDRDLRRFVEATAH